jgi:hypothetical protein
VFEPLIRSRSQFNSGCLPPRIKKIWFRAAFHRIFVANPRELILIFRVKVYLTRPNFGAFKTALFGISSRPRSHTANGTWGWPAISNSGAVGLITKREQGGLTENTMSIDPTQVHPISLKTSMKLVSRTDDPVLAGSRCGGQRTTT